MARVPSIAPLKMPIRSSSTGSIFDRGEKSSSPRSSRTPRVFFEGVRNCIFDATQLQKLAVKISGVYKACNVAQWLTSFINMNDGIYLTINCRDIYTPRDSSREDNLITLAECSFNIPLLGWPFFESRRIGAEVLSLISMDLVENISTMLMNRGSNSVSIEKTIDEEKRVVVIRYSR